MLLNWHSIYLSRLLHRGNSFQRQNYKMRLKQRSLNGINSMQVKKILFTNVFFSWLLCLPLCLCTLWIYRMTSLVSCCARIVNQNKWLTLLHDRADVTTRYIHSVHKHRGNSFQRQNYKMRLKQRSLNGINSMEVKNILFTNVFFSWMINHHVFKVF
jgi:hypothetical protein